MPFDHESMDMVIPDWRDTPSELTERSAQDIADALRIVKEYTPGSGQRILRVFINLSRSFPQFESVWADAENGLFDDMLETLSPAKLAELIISADKMDKDAGRQSIPQEVVDTAKFIKILIVDDSNL